MVFKIQSIKAKEILDSKGQPTVEVVLKAAGKSFKASVPSGVSQGDYEAVE
ncbi:MAG: phosphopyruvate hydratase, partial [Patescibacteria group bacterium]